MEGPSDGPQLGDILLGITRDCGDALPARLALGCNFLMGREDAPPSIMYGGGSCRCVYTRGDGSGPQIDQGRVADVAAAGAGRPGRLSKMLKVGDWVEFSLRGGVLHGRDCKGREFIWWRRVLPGEVWWPTVTWAGIRQWRVRIAPPAGAA